MAEYMAAEIFDKHIDESAYKVELDIEDRKILGIKFPKEKLAWIETVNGGKIRHTSQPQTSAWRRFNLSVYSVLPIESQL